MSAVTGVLQDLVRRRLWPVAVLLIVAAVAAPILLAAEPEPVAPPVVDSGPAETLPIASLVDDFSADARRRVLGAAKDPFTPTGRQPRAAEADTPPSAGSTSTGEATAARSGGSSASGGSGASAGGGSSPTGGAPAGQLPTPAAPAPSTDPGTGEETYALHSLKVRWDDGEPRQLERLAPLPDEENPAVIYLGLLKDAKTAVFLLDDGVTTEGDGDCRPSPEDCQRVHLKKGETQFFSVPAEGDDGAGMATEHQLDLVSITTKRTKSASKARKSFATTSKAGRRALRSRTDRLGRLRFDPRTGLLRAISVQAHRAAVARAARR